MNRTHAGQTGHRPARKLLSCALISCLALGAIADASAQSANATLRGQVVSASAGTEVTATNVATGSVRRTQTGADGGYILVGLEPGTYTVQANGSSQTVTLTVASTATLDLGSKPAASGPATTLDAVNVTAPVLQEVRTSEIAKTVSLQQIQTVPQMSRNFLEFADAVPGMIFTRDAQGHTSLRGGAQNSSSTNVYIDGVGQKSYVKEGGVAGQFGSAGNPFPQLAIGEYKVITSNYKAEYGQISSAAVTAATKSGTNDFHGEAFYRYTDEDMRARTPAEKQPGKDKTSSAEKEYGFALGGPIIQDKLHFFVTYEAKRFDLPVTIVPDGAATGAVASLPADAAAQLGPASQAFQQDLFFGKIDWEPTDADRFELSYQDRDETQDGFSGSTAPSSGTTTDNYDKRYALRWNHSAYSWYNEVLLTHEDSYNIPLPRTYGNGYVYTTPNGDQDPTVIQVGGASPLSAQTKGQKGWSVEDNLTLNSFTWHGDHTVKMGVKYKAVDLEAADALDINPQYYYTLDNPAFPDDVPYAAVFSNPVAGLQPTVKTSAKQIGLYIQDDWQVNDHLMLNIGVRWDYERNPAYLDFVTPQTVLDALNGQDPNGPVGQTYAQTLALGGLNVNDYISTGRNRHAFKDAWQPRLGFSYDVDADEMHVIHGGIGRSYDRDLFDYLQLETTKVAMPQVTIGFRNPVSGNCYTRNITALFCTDWNPAYLQNGLQQLQALVGSTRSSEVDLLSNNLKTPYSDQFSFGMSNQMGDWMTDVTVSRVLSYDGFAFTLGNRYPNGNFWNQASLCDPKLAGTPDDYYGQPWKCGLPGFGGLIVGNNGIETRTTQVLLSAQKPYSKESGWGASVAYTWTNARQNRDINEHYSFDAATIGDYPFIKSNATPRHRLVFTGSYDGFWGITFGGKLTLATPTPGNSNLRIDTAGINTPNGIPAAATPGGNGRFLLGGKVWGYRSVDLQATKEWAVAGDAKLYARLDILNVFDFENFSTLNYTTRDGKLIASYNETGEITGLPRQVKVEVGFKF